MTQVQRRGQLAVLKEVEPVFMVVQTAESVSIHLTDCF